MKLNSKIAVTFMIMFSGFALNAEWAGASETTDIITGQQAILIAKQHVINTVSEEDGCDWKDGVNLSGVTPLYDLDENVSAYCVSVDNMEGEDNGYIVISSNRHVYPVIEYSTSGQSIIDIAVKGRSNNDVNKFYYCGNLTYLMQDNQEEFYDISSGEVIKAELSGYENIPESERADTDENYEYLPLFETYSNNDTEITNPDLYEKNYVSKSGSTVLNNLTSYFTMDDFEAGNIFGLETHCTPTAMTNLMLYYYKMNTSKYGNLLNGTWQKTFDELYKDVKCTLEDGTFEVNMGPGLKKYLTGRGYTNSSVIFKNPRGDGAEDEIIDYFNNTRRPCIISTNHHGYYKTHTMLGVGYVRYMTQSSGIVSYPTYVRLADSWHDRPNRYVYITSEPYTWSFIEIGIK